MTLNPFFYVIALKPRATLRDFIAAAKTKTEAIAGDQIYLSHPPHLTLYVSAFEDREVLLEQCHSLANEIAPPEINLIGWHYFAGDVLTGNQTLVVQLDHASIERLRSIQQRVLERLSPLRNAPVSHSRYSKFFSTLSPERQLAVEKYGFPFVGNDWIPHMTIASIDPKKWDLVWSALASSPPVGPASFEALEIFILRDDFPHSHQTLPFRSA